MTKIHFALVAALLTACAGGPADEEIMTKDEARQRAGKADDGVDLCDEFGWYADGVCDDFCAFPDPDCEVTCTSSQDCEAGMHCSTEDGDCDSLCEPGEVCPQVCAGVCVTDEIDSCWGAWTDQAGNCRSPSDGLYPAECCQPEEPDSCGGLAGLTCGEGEFCSYDAEAQCGAADQLGSCAPKPEACITLFDPVCGCDGETYSNSCFAAMAGVSVVHAGECASF